MNAKKHSEESISEREIKKMLKNIVNREVRRTSDLKSKEKKELFAYLKENSEDKEDGKCLCHYCGIYCGENGEEFKKIWGKGCYGKNGKPDSGRKRLEIEHKNNLSSDKNISREKRFQDYWDLDNLTLACPICNIAKGDQFTEDEFEKVGKVIRKIWKQRTKPKKSSL